MPRFYNLIVTMALTFPGPAAAQAKEKPDKFNILATFDPTRLVH